MAYNGPVRRFDWTTLTSYLDVQATVEQPYTTTDWVHGHNGECVQITYETTLGSRDRDITQALREYGYNPQDFYNGPTDGDGKPGGYHISSSPY